MAGWVSAGGELRLYLASRTKGCVFKNVEAFTHRPQCICCFDLPSRPVVWVAGVLLLDIREDQTGADSEAFATNKALFSTARNDRLENMAQQVTLAETTMAVLRKSRMIWNAVRQIEMPINQPQQMTFRDMILQREIVEQRRLRFLLRSYHR